MGERKVPRATYRIQFRKEFPFAACAAEADYLLSLGVSHVYASPILTARAGSAHGYDVVRYDQINPELGGAADFRLMAAALRNHDISIILDIVPNHVAVGGADNPMWLDCLKHGRKSAYASWFDIDWDTPDSRLAGKLHAPFLGQPLQQVLQDRSLSLGRAADGNGHVFQYGEHVFPVRPEDDDDIVQDGLAAWQTPEALGRLLGRQHYVLDHWRNAGDRINWRRFFDITQLAAMRMEVPAAFDAAHAVPLMLYQEGLIDGLRVDHIDGLADPAAYCLQLRAEMDARQALRPATLRHQRAWLVVEKILAPGERLPAGWDVDGTTGYDFMNEVSALQHQMDSVAVLSRHWAGISGRPASFHDEEILARRQVLEASFDGQRERLVDALVKAAGEQMDALGVTRSALRRACTDVLCAMRAYRGYVTRPRADGSPGPQIEAALARAMANSMTDAPALALLVEVFGGRLGDLEDCATALRRFNQLSAPLAAKAVEDTAFYRYGRLLSRNDVGFDADRLGLETDDFHALMKDRAAVAPSSMLATATHDHKRGEDARARLAVLSEIPETWLEACSRWQHMTNSVAPDGLTAGDRHMFHQMLIASWPPELQPGDADALRTLSDRLAAWWVKALREAKLRSTWSQPDQVLEQGVRTFVAAVLDPVTSGVFVNDIAAFVKRIERPAAANGLTQMALRCLVPGVPDLYQGTEFWDFSMVDPDNRRPVDFRARRQALEAGGPVSALIANWRDGRVKQAVLRSILALRRSHHQVFSGGAYVQLPVSGPRADHLVAFLREDSGDRVLVMTARCLAGGLRSHGRITPDSGWWGNTAVSLPPGGGRWTSVIGPELTDDHEVLAADVLQVLPLGIWTSRQKDGR